MKRRDERHIQPRQQRHDVMSGLSAEDAELVLQARDLELPGVQEVSGPRIVLYVFVADLHADGGRIVVSAAAVVHGCNGGFRAGKRLGNRLLQIGGERGDSAAARQRIADKCQTAE